MGKVYKLQQKVKTKYLAVSPVMDICERLFSSRRISSILISLIKLDGLNLSVIGTPGGLQCVLSYFDKLKVFQK